MYKYWCLILLFVACKAKQIDLSGNSPVKITELIQVFKPAKEGIQIADTNLLALEDTIHIGYKLITQFVPDSIFTELYDNKVSKQIQIHPVFAIKKEKETYLLINCHYKKEVDLIVVVFNEKNKYEAWLPLITKNNDDDYVHLLNTNNEPTFFISQEKLDNQKQLKYTKVGWAFNGSNFIPVLNDGNEDERKNDVINPIDTLPQKNKWSGNYVLDKKNFISIRDTKRNNEYLFFLHTLSEKNCEGELKGTFKLVNETSAIYAKAGDLCGIEFTLEGKEITLKENGKCGNRRGLDCSFNKVFKRQKEILKKKKK